MMRYPQAAILIFAKAPVEGRVKTRLIPALGRAGAARLYRELLHNQVDRLAAEALAPVELWCAPDANHPDFQTLNRHPGVTLHVQRGDDLGERMAYAAADALQRHRHLILLGVDCPALTRSMLEQTLRWLVHEVDLVLGPAEDGGYCLLGLNQTADCLFHGLPWGTDAVADATRGCLRDMGWAWRELPLLWDLDRAEDLQRLAASGYSI